VGQNAGMSRVSFQKLIEQRLRCWAGRHKALEKMLREVGAEEKPGLSIDLSRLKTIEAEGRRCLAVVEAAGTDVWARLQADFVERWDRANRAAEDVWARAK
jgi:hypothetical protein